jgi:hypothetical protein
VRAARQLGYAKLAEQVGDFVPLLANEFRLAWLEHPMHESMDARADAPDHVRRP